MDKLSIPPFIESPYTALVIAIVLGGVAISGKFSVTATQLMLVAAWVVAMIGLREQPIPLLVGFGAMFGGLLLVLGYWARPDAVPAWTGLLRPETKSIVLFAAKGADAARNVEIGDSGTIIHYVGPEGTPTFQFAADQNLIVESVGGILKVSTQVKDSNGHLVAELVRNEWKVAPPPATWDRNYTNDALEIRGPDGSIMLQIVVMPDRIRIQGEWWLDNAHGIRLASLGPGKGAAVTKLVPNMIPTQAPAIRPLFVYPSASHFGELAQ